MARVKIERNIYLDENRNKYYVSLDYGKDENGKRIQKFKTFTKLSEARKELRRHESDRDANQIVIPKEQTFVDWMDYWLKTVVEPTRAKTTVYAYRKMLENHIKPYFKGDALQKIKPIRFQEYYTYLIAEKGLSVNTARKHHDFINSAMKYAYKQDMIKSNPLDKIEPPKLTRSKINFYKTEDLQKLLELAENTRLELTIKLAGCLGLRREELLGITWDKIDFESKTITISDARTAAGKEIVFKDTKNDSSYRILCFTSDIEESIKKEQAKQSENKFFFKSEYIDSNYVIVDGKGKPYRPNYLSEIFTRFIKENRLPPVTLHGLRHTFASVANAMGVPQFEISKALGHSTPAITGKIYTHVFDDTHAGIVNVVQDAIDDKKK